MVIVLGFLVASFLTRVSNDMGEIAGGEKIATSSATTFGETQKEYRVKEGDSLSAIAQSAYGDMAMWQALAIENKIANPNLIYPDTKLKIPAKEQADADMKTLTKTSWNVQEGDTLSDIAQSVYGDASRWTLIAKANRVGYLPNGNPLIFAGTTITIPR